eukprot:1091513-Prorocentrum_minimum.AAC.1
MDITGWTISMGSRTAFVGGTGFSGPLALGSAGRGLLGGDGGGGGDAGAGRGGAEEDTIDWDGASEGVPVTSARVGPTGGADWSAELLGYSWWSGAGGHLLPSVDPAAKGTSPTQNRIPLARRGSLAAPLVPPPRASACAASPGVGPPAPAECWSTTMHGPQARRRATAAQVGCRWCQAGR